MCVFYACSCMWVCVRVWLFALLIVCVVASLCMSVCLFAFVVVCVRVVLCVLMFVCGRVCWRLCV